MLDAGNRVAGTLGRGLPDCFQHSIVFKKNLGLELALVTTITRADFKTALRFPTSSVLFMRDGGDHEEVHDSSGVSSRRDRGRTRAGRLRLQTD